MNIINQSDILKALQKNSRFDELLRKHDTFLGIGEGISEILDYLSKECQSNKFFSIGANCQDTNILSLSSSFETTTLVDKQVDVIFCNPSLEEYEICCKRIFEECLARYVFVVLPMEWKENAEIKAYAKANKFESDMVGAVGYVKDNKRAKAEFILFYHSSLSDRTILGHQLSKEYALGHLFQELDHYRFALITEEQEKKRAEIAKECEGKESEAILEYLLKQYEREHNEFFANFKHLSKISSLFLSTIKVESEYIIDNTKSFERKLKRFYWSEYFSRVLDFNLLLTPKQQSDLLDEFAERGVDFSRENTASVLAFSLKYCKERERENFIVFWEKLASEDNLVDFTNLIANPKPYTHYAKEKLFFKGKLKEKVVCTYAGSYEDYYPNHLRDVRIAYLLKILLQSLGYQDLSYRDSNKDLIKPNDRIDLPLGTSYLFAGEKQVAKFTAYKNRKLHIHFNQTTIALINLRVFIYLGWITNIKEAKESFDTLKSELLTQELQTLPAS